MQPNDLPARSEPRAARGRLLSRRAWLAVAVVLALGAAGMLILASRRTPVGTPVTVANHVDSRQCVACHQAQGEYLGTAHFRSSQRPAPGVVLGDFGGGHNVLRTGNPYLHYRMEIRDGAHFQTAVVGPPGQTRSLSERVDVVIGSGRKGQTSLFWRGGQLYQLPVSYWTAPGRWANSPGYNDGLVNFNRIITPRCLECHATYVEARTESGFANLYDTTSVRLGISCEKCHGAGREHVERQGSWSARLLGQGIVSPARLPRERQMEVCALCHSGVGESKRPPFSFAPGMRLGDYLHVPPRTPGEAADVHGNQVGLLRQSACFQASQMTCSTCHDVHRTQREAAAFSPTCLSCHTARSCGLFPERGAALARNCVDCHMPEQPSRVIVSTFEGQRAQPMVRTHWIRVYPETRDRPLPREGAHP